MLHWIYFLSHAPRYGNDRGTSKCYNSSIFSCLPGPVALLAVITPACPRSLRNRSPEDRRSLWHLHRRGGEPSARAAMGLATCGSQGDIYSLGGSARLQCAGLAQRRARAGSCPPLAALQCRCAAHKHGWHESHDPVRSAYPNRSRAAPGRRWHKLAHGVRRGRRHPGARPSPPRIGNWFQADAASLTCGVTSAASRWPAVRRQPQTGAASQREEGNVALCGNAPNGSKPFKTQDRSASIWSDHQIEARALCTDSAGTPQTF